MPKTPLKRTATKEADEEQETPTQTSGKKKGGLSSLANAFNQSTGMGGFSVGKHEANIVNFELIESDKGTSAKIEYKGADGDDDEGKKMSQFYSLMKADGTVGQGVDFLKADLIKLGYEDPQFEDLEAIFKEITDNEPLVELKVVQNGSYLNAYLQGVIE